MKYRKLYAMILTITLLTTFFTGCAPKPEEKTDLETMINFRSTERDIVSLTVGENAEVYAARYEKGFARYSPEGELLKEYPDTENIYGLYYYGGFVYGYNEITGKITQLDTKTETMRTVCKDFNAAELRALAADGEYVYAVTVPSFNNLDYTRDEDGYMSFREQLFAVEISSGEVSEITGIKNPITLYRGSDGKLCVLAHPDNGYKIYTYDAREQKVTQVAAVKNTGYIFAFAYEGGNLIYNSDMGNIKIRRVSDGFTYTGAEIFATMFGGCFTYYDGSVVFIEQRDAGEGDIVETDSAGHPIPYTFVRTLILGEEFSTLLEDGSSAETVEDKKVEFLGNITISSSYYNKLFSTDYILKTSGIDGKYMEQPTSSWKKYQEFLTSILAGNEDIDIYILHLNEQISSELRDKGGFVPLTESEKIKNYLNGCFDWVRDAATTPEGEIWMLPLAVDTTLLWYVEDNFNAAGLTAGDVEYYEDYLKTVERLNGEDDDYTTHATYLTYADSNWFWQYEKTYNDYANGKGDFCTDIFRSYFDSMWTGWLYNGDPVLESSRHPILQADKVYSQHIISGELQPDYDTEKVIFKTELMSFHVNNTGKDIDKWRALPLPRLTEEVEHNYIQTTFAVVNPYGKNKDLAIAYLEAAAENMASAVNKAAYVREDLADYKGYPDMDIPVYRDLYNIFKNGAVVSEILPNEEYLTIITDYQNGELTLDEAIDEIQRKAEFWMYE